MIQTFQKFSQSRIAKVFLAIVALSFMVFFGGNSWFNSRNSHSVVAEVGPLPIGAQQLVEKVHQQIQLILAQSTKQMTREDLIQAGLPYMVLRELIQETLLTLEAEKLGLTVSDEDLKKQIHTLPAFQNSEGKFNRALFTQLLRTNGLSEDAFISALKADLIREQLVRAITIGVTVPPELVDRLFDAQYQYRHASLLVLSPSQMPSPPQPSLGVLEDFYKAHKKDFTLPERRTFTFVTLDPTMFSKDIAVTEEEIQSTYASKGGAFDNKPLSQVRPLILADIQKEKALDKAYQLTQDLEDKIAGGATLEEVVTQTPGLTLVTVDQIDGQGRPYQEGSKASLPQDEAFRKDLLQTAFSLEEGGDSPFSQTHNGLYYTVRVDKILVPTLPSFSDMKEKVHQVWATLEQLKAAKEKAKSYVEAINKGETVAARFTPLPALSLSEVSPSVSNEVKDLVCSLSLHHAGMTFTPEGIAVVVLNSITPPTAQVREDKIQAFRDAVSQAYKEDVLIAYLNALRVRYPIKINQTTLQALFAPQGEK